MDDGRLRSPLSISEISISGPTLASLLHLLSSSHSDCDGLLFGHLSFPPSPVLHDDHQNSPKTALSLSITSLLSLSSPSSLSEPSLLSRLLSSSSSSSSFLPVGWFSARRNTPLRPSMRERFFTSQLSRRLLSSSAHLSSPPPCLFLLLTSSLSPNLALHTYQYRAYQLSPRGALEPTSLSIVNIGPGFRGQYGAFSPTSAFPWLPPWSTDGGKVSQEERLKFHKDAEGFKMERLGRLVGQEADVYTRELEDLYRNMLAQLDLLTRKVEESDARVNELELQNMTSRCKDAGLWM